MVHALDPMHVPATLDILAVLVLLVRAQYCADSSVRYYTYHVAICTSECVHGICAGPDTCKCDDGYYGNVCSNCKLVTDSF